MKEFMMPQTVPKRPTKGAVEPMVATMPVPFDIRRAACASMRERREATRSFRPAPSTWPRAGSDMATSCRAARTSRLAAPGSFSSFTAAS